MKLHGRFGVGSVGWVTYDGGMFHLLLLVPVLGVVLALLVRRRRRQAAPLPPVTAHRARLQAMSDDERREYFKARFAAMSRDEQHEFLRRLRQKVAGVR